MNKETQAALAAGQATAQQGAAYAALPTSSYAGRAYEEGFLIGTCPLYTADQLHAFADATHTLRASHGQAPATAQADQPIACSYGDNGYACCEGGPCQADVHNNKLAEQQAPATAQAESVQEDAARHFFDAGWKACANFCDRDDVRFDGIVGHRGCPQFDEAFRAARKQGGV